MSTVIVIIIVLVVVFLTSSWVVGSIKKGISGINKLEPPKSCEYGVINEKCKCGNEIFNPKGKQIMYCCSGKLSYNPCLAIIEYVSISVPYPNVYVGGSYNDIRPVKLSADNIEILFDKKVDSGKLASALRFYSTTDSNPKYPDDWDIEHVVIDVNNIQQGNFVSKLGFNLVEGKQYLITIDPLKPLTVDGRTINPSQTFIRFTTWY